MKRYSWPRLLLWSHVIGVIGFYLTLWLRTNPRRGIPRALAGSKTNPAQEPAILKNPLVSIIVPARNEERNIRRCVTSLLEQDYEHYEVIVVDDGSTDDTGCILDDIAQTHPHGNRLWVLRLKDLPEGWTGKPHALYAGAREAHGDWLLFTDADTWHAPNALRSSLAQAIDERIDVFSLMTRQELPGFWNKVMMPMAFTGISMMYPFDKVNDPSSPVALANGQYILMRRSVYEVIGGYGRPDLRHSLVDDRDLAWIVKANGFRLRLVDGRALVSTQMYDSLDEIWRGWRKNSFVGSRGGLPFVLLMLLGLPMISIVPFLLPLLGRSRTIQQAVHITSAEATIAGTLEVSSVLVYRKWVDQWLNVPWYYAFTHPLAGALFDTILAQSTWRILTRKGVDWRGRQYRTT
jgi:chlorobactene glucosyltransferase